MNRVKENRCNGAKIKFVSCEGGGVGSILPVIIVFLCNLVSPLYLCLYITLPSHAAFVGSSFPPCPFPLWRISGSVVFFPPFPLSCVYLTMLFSRSRPVPLWLVFFPMQPPLCGICREMIFCVIMGPTLCLPPTHSFSLLLSYIQEVSAEYCLLSGS